MPEATPFNLPFQEAVDFFRSKGYAISPESWRDVWQEAHAQAFTVARVTAMDVLVDIRGEAQKALDAGISLGEFKKDLIPTLQKKGWWKPEGEKAIVEMPDGTERKRLTPWRLETIYRTNTQAAYGTGRWKQIQEVKDRRPYLQYKAIMDSRTRDGHAEMNDKVYPVDHPIWDTMTPLNGFNCRCYVKSLTAKQVESRGLPISEKAPDDVQADEGWNYNPGKAGLAAWKPDLKKYDPAAQKALKKSLADPPKAPEIPATKWTAAKTVKEAEAWAKKEFGAVVSGFDDVDVLNKYTAAMSQARPLNVSKIKAWDRDGGRILPDVVDKKTGAVISYEIFLPKKGMRFIPKVTDAIDGIPGALELFYDEKYNYKLDFIKSKFLQGTSVKTTKDIALHELGHAITFQAKLPKGMKDWSEVEFAFQAWFRASKNKGIFSAYGMTDYSEALAEAAVEFWNGTYKNGMLPQFLEDILLGALKP